MVTWAWRPRPRRRSPASHLSLDHLRQPIQTRLRLQLPKRIHSCIQSWWVSYTWVRNCCVGKRKNQFNCIYSNPVTSSPPAKNGRALRDQSVPNFTPMCGVFAFSMNMVDSSQSVLWYYINIWTDEAITNVTGNLLPGYQFYLTTFHHLWTRMFAYITSDYIQYMFESHDVTFVWKKVLSWLAEEDTCSTNTGNAFL